MIKIKCTYCGETAYKTVSHYNRAVKTSPNMYCSKACVGLSRRTTIEEKKRIKAEYDKRLRQDHVYMERRKKIAQEYFKKDYAANPEKYRKERKRRYKKHLKYLSTPEYKAWKKEYDVQHLAKKHYGEFAEAAIVLSQLEKFLDSKAIKYSINITQNKSCRNRKRKSIRTFQQRA